MSMNPVSGTGAGGTGAGGTGVPPVTGTHITATSLRHMHVLLIVAMAIGSFGGWAVVFTGVGALRWPLLALSGVLSSVMLTLLARATVRASTRTTHGDWAALAIAACFPVIRIFAELILVKRMSRAVAAHLDDRSIANRAFGLVTVRAVLSGLQVIAPMGLVWFMPLSEWSIYIALGVGALVMVLLMALATHVVIAPLATLLEAATPVKLGGAGNDESVAVSTVR